MAFFPENEMFWTSGNLMTRPRRGAVRRVLVSMGPERIEPEWWRGKHGVDPSHSVRDYFKIQDETGCWLWIYREGTTGEWFLHGQWA